MDNKPTNTNKKAVWMMLSLSGELGLIIVIPLVALVLTGIKLDRLLAIFPLFTIIGMLGALTISSLVIARKIKQINSVK